MMLAPEEQRTFPSHANGQPSSTSPATHPGRPDTVNAGLTSKRPRHLVENDDEYGAFARCVLRTYSRRVGDGDVEALALMLGLGDRLDMAAGVGCSLAAPVISREESR
jgi:hypothetical protein